MTWTVLYLAGAVAALALSALFSGVETGTYCVNRLRLRLAAEQAARGARRLARLMERPEELVITTLVGTNVADYLLTASVTALLLKAALPAQIVEVYATAIATPLVLVFGGLVPKDWFRRDADRLMPRLAALVDVCRRLTIATGVMWLLREWTHLLIRRIDPQTAAREAAVLPRARTLRLLREAAVYGGLTAAQRDMMERVLKISKVPLVKIMVPRQRAAIVPVDIPRDDLLRIARMAHFSRLPVYRDDPRKIVGVVNVYDILTDAEQRPVAAHVQPPLLLRADETVPAALVKLQQTHNAMAIVTDAAGNCLGLFTMKDLVEEIIGELEAW